MTVMRSFVSSCDAPGTDPQTVLDPNSWASDEVLVFAEPSPDGSLVAFGKAVGSSHGPLISILDVETGQVLPDRPRAGTTRPSPGGRMGPGSSSWRRPAGRGYRRPSTSTRSDRAPARVFGGDQLPEYWCSVEVSECGRFAVLYTWDFVHANTVHLLRLADGAVVPVAPAMRSLNRVQVIDEELLIHTDLDAPRGRLCIAPSVGADAVADPHPRRARHAADGHRRRRPAVRRLLAGGVASGARLRGGRCLPARVALPALGSVNSNTGGGMVSGVSGAWHGTRCGCISSRSCSRHRCTGMTTRPTS